MKTKKTILFITIIFIILMLFFSSKFVLKKFIYKNEYIDIISSTTSNYCVDPYLILSIIKAESGFDKMAKSSKDAYGLMQILPSTAEEVNKELNLVEEINDSVLYTPEFNIVLGTKYMDTLIKHYKGNYLLAICAYNAGYGTVDKWLQSNTISSNLEKKDIESIPYPETQKYLKKVVSNYSLYRILY